MFNNFSKKNKSLLFSLKSVFFNNKSFTSKLFIEKKFLKSMNDLKVLTIPISLPSYKIVKFLVVK